MGQSTPQPQQISRNRLTSLAEVLRRSTFPFLRKHPSPLPSPGPLIPVPLVAADTRPPVDLYCYYLFLQREGGEDTLDFWLDVQQHENLCAFLSEACLEPKYVVID